MSVNLETKAKVACHESIRDRIKLLAGEFKYSSNQIDTYYNISNGKLKLRVIDNIKAILIAYKRENQRIAKNSSWKSLSINDHRRTNELLNFIFGTLVKVKKRREVWKIKNTELHLDYIDDFGCFVELETGIGNFPKKDAEYEHNNILRLLGIKEENFIDLSYSDLILGAKNELKLLT